MELQNVSGVNKLNEKDEVTSSKKKSCTASYKAYPKHIFFIIGNEFCERFSFYGMRTVLVLYARNFLLFDDDTATSIFHAFTVLAYLTPLLGGILADSYWGKYKTIAYLSIIYVIGHALKTVAAIPYIPSRTTHLVLSITGLLLIALGTGGIKPCVTSFGGDQFSSEQVQFRSQFFSLFYFAINAGALLSKWLTPIFRADLDCYPGHDEPQFQECFSVAFGVPGVLMFLAFVLFLAGSKYYTRLEPEGSIFWKFCKCVFSGCKNRWKLRNNEELQTKDHWVDYADAPKNLKRDTKHVLRVLYLFIPLPFFWALFDQQGSRWTLQALQLDGYWGDYLVKPDQIDVVNPFLIVTLIPLFEATLYPLLRHYKINFSPIRRMTAGLLLAGISFICAAVLQFEIDKGLTPLPAADQFSVRVINTAPCDVTLSSSSHNRFDGLHIASESVSGTKSDFLDANINLNLQYPSCDNLSVVYVNINGSDGHVIDVVIGGQNGEQTFQSLMPTKKLENGKSILTFINMDSVELSLQSSDFSLNVLPGERSNLTDVGKGKTDFDVFLQADGGREHELVYNGSVHAEPGGVYSVVLKRNPTNSKLIEAVEFSDGLPQLVDMDPNTINIAWMIPQYFVITVGEVFLSITGLEFSYTQAPLSMKSVVTSFWLLTVSMGNVIVMMIANAQAIERQAHEFLFFAGLIGVATIIFCLMARGYKLAKDEDFQDKEEDNQDDPLLSPTLA